MSALYPLALGVTLASELLGAGIVGSLLLRRALRRCLLVCLLVNLLVHPLFWNGFGHLPGGYWTRLLLGETLVVLAEGSLYRWLTGLPWRWSLGLSLVLNLASTLAGLGLWRLI